MLYNVEPVDKLRGLARARARAYETKTVHPKLVEEELKNGWTKDKEQKTSIRLKRDKTHSTLLEHKVWSLLYGMGFTYLSGEGGAKISLNPKDPDSKKQQIDVVAIDDDVAMAIECKSQENYGKRPEFSEELGKHALIREQFANAINAQFPTDHKRECVLVMFLNNAQLDDDNEKERAKQAKIILFDQQDLRYYGSLIEQIGPVAKYQFFSDIMPTKEVPGLRIRVPAVRTKMGGTNCYSFCISPEYLLKISFVSHRAKGKASDVDTYQRMLKKSRLKKIRDYITNDGIFPTNIVLNLDKKYIQFEPIHQGNDEYILSGSGKLGWLEIRPTYKSAWIIDGQHRLYAYSGYKDASKSLLSVLAFEGLLPSTQAKFFIDINAEQKKVKKSLLNELYAELHWDADEPRIYVSAIISKAIQDLSVDPESPFYQRIQMSDDNKSPIQCISLASIYGAIEKKGFYIVKEKHGQVVEFGPLWNGERQHTLKRTTFVLKNWFNLILKSSKSTEEWWNKGSAEGGGLAMNDSVIACINVLHSVFDHLDSTGQKLVHLDNDDLLECIKKYGEALGQYLGSLSEVERKEFRSLRGGQGQTTRTRLCEKGIRSQIPDFNPPGLTEWLNLEKAETKQKAKEILDRMEVTLQNQILEELRREFGPDDSQWWIMGVPKNIRKKVTQVFEEDDGKRGGKEYYFDLIDYRKIAVENWELFESLLAYGKKGSKESRTDWMDFVNEQRKLVAHPSSGVSVSLENLTKLQEYDKWLADQVSAAGVATIATAENYKDD